MKYLSCTVLVASIVFAFGAICYYNAERAEVVRVRKAEARRVKREAEAEFEAKAEAEFEGVLRRRAAVFAAKMRKIEAGIEAELRKYDTDFKAKVKKIDPEFDLEAAMRRADTTIKAEAEARKKYGSATADEAIATGAFLIMHQEFGMLSRVTNRHDLGSGKSMCVVQTDSGRKLEFAFYRGKLIGVGEPIGEGGGFIFHYGLGP